LCIAQNPGGVRLRASRTARKSDGQGRENQTQNYIPIRLVMITQIPIPDSPGRVVRRSSGERRRVLAGQPFLAVLVGRAHPRLVSSVVVTPAQVIHNDKSWPAGRLRMNLFVQVLANRAQRVLKNINYESNRTFGLGISTAFKDWVVGSPSSVNFDGIMEADLCVAPPGLASTFGSTRTLDECSGGGWLSIEKICVNPSLSTDQTTRASVCNWSPTRRELSHDNTSLVRSADSLR